MGSRNAQAYLASPEVVAASAVSGYIDVAGFDDVTEIVGKVTARAKPAGKAEKNVVIDGFPDTITGELIFCHKDNMNTDGIYPGKYTYIDDFTAEQQAGVVMENYDPGFGKIVKAGDILVGGFNFGTGSSREQAATALKYRGIKLVLAGSFSETYKRNALNNGFLTIEAPELISDLKTRFGSEKLTVKTGMEATIDFGESEVRVGDKSYPIAPVGAAAQELVVVDGLENWIKHKIGG
jgi:homoaconitate hydratase